MAETPSTSAQVRPLEIGDITVIDNTKLKKAVTAAARGNADLLSLLHHSTPPVRVGAR